MKMGIRRSIAMLLTVCMVLTMLPAVTAIAAESMQLIAAGDWTVVNANENGVIHSANSISITTELGDFGDNNDPVDNYWIMTPESTDYIELTVKLSGGMTADYQKAGVMVYHDDETIASMTRRYHSGLGNNVLGLYQWTQSGGWTEPRVTDTQPEADVWLKLVKDGTSFTGYYRYDGTEDWTLVDTMTNEVVAGSENMKIGVYAVSGSYNRPVTVTMTDFAVKYSADEEAAVIPFGVESAEGVSVSSVNLSRALLDLEEGETAQLNSVVRYSSAASAYPALEWVSDDESVVTVEDGLVTAVGNGSAIITARQGDVKAQCQVTVHDAGTGTYLSDYPADKYTADVGWGSLGLDAGVNNSGSISLKDGLGNSVTYEKGLTAHAASTLVFDITDMNIVRFAADIGVNDSKGSCGFTVKTDLSDEAVLDVECVYGDGPVQNISVAIPEGATQLILETDNGDGNGNNDHSSWGAARIFAASEEEAVKTLQPAEGWTIGNSDENGVIVDENTLSITTQLGDFGNDSNAGAPDNYWIRTPADEDFNLTVKVSGGMYGNYQKAGIMVFANEQNVASVVRRYHSGLSGANGNVLGMYQWSAAEGWTEPAVSDPEPDQDVYLKLVKTDSKFEGYYSFDGETWTACGSTTNTLVSEAENMQIGVYAVQGSGSNVHTVTLSDFTYNGTPIPFGALSEAVVEIQRVTLDETAINLEVGAEKQLTASVYPTYATDKTVTWSSDNESVATVTEGLVTAIGSGEAVITASAGGFSAQCSVTVTEVGQYAYLSDWQWVSANTDWDTVRKDTGVEGSAISLIIDESGTRGSYAKAIAAHAASKVVFDIEGMGVKRFISDVGVNKANGDCGFIVMADDQILYEIDVVSYNEMVKHIDVEVPAGAKQLILITNDGGDGNSYDHSVWAGAMVELDPSVRENLRKIAISVPSYLPVEGIGTVTVSGELVKGDAADLTAAQITYESSDETVLTVADGILTGVGNGTATVTVTVTLNGVTKTASAQVVVGEDEDTMWVIASPNGEKKAVFMLDESGAARYIVLNGSSAVVDSSVLGLVSSAGDFTGGLTFVSRSEITEVTDSYDLIGAKVSYVDAVGNEMTLTFTKDGAIFRIIVRMYDDGVAFRYAIDGEGELTISSEATTVQIPTGSTVYAMNYIAHNEAVETKYALNALSGDFCEPMLYETTGGTWALISEAALTGEYCGTYLKGDGTGSVNFHFSREQSGDVVTTMPFETPWRFVVVGTAAEINLNTMAETLSPECEGDFSWVEPGVTAWTWLNRESTSSGETYMRYVDFAAEMGWEYLLLDEGWQPRGSSIGKVYAGYYDWFDELLAYANEKGVKLLVWANHNDLKDDAYREQVFAEWEELGIAGVKPDFFDSSSQTYMQLYEDMIEDTAKYHLLLNLHGIPKPAGERRTYPHLLTREGVFGHEQELFKPAEMSAYHNTMLPFVRNAVGPADYTPMFSYRNSGSARNFSLAHMAAMAVVYESGIQCLADRPEIYQGSPAEMYFYDMPASWDESLWIEADPGERAIMARRSGENWYVGGMTVEACTSELELSFLGEGEYYAIIVTDGETIEECAGQMQVVTAKTVLTLPMLETGGFAIRILREDPTADEIELDKTELVVPALSSDTVTATAYLNGEAVDTMITWTSSDESVATVSGGTVTGVSGGTATITATIEKFDGTKISDSCTVTVTPSTYEVAEGWEVVNADPRGDKWDIEDENTVTILPQYGDYYYSGGTLRATAKNVFLHDVEQADFEITVKVDFKPSVNYTSAGLIIYAGDDANFALTRRYHSYFGGKALCTQGVDGTSFRETDQADPSSTQEPIWMKISKTGNVLTCYYSLDGESWTAIEDGSITWNTFEGVEAADLKVGIYTGDSMSSNNAEAVFSNFTIQYPEDAEQTPLPFAVRNVVSVYSVSLDKTEAELAEGETIALTASILPGNADVQDVTWTSDNASVATVENGVVTAVGAGTATITVTTVDGGKTASCVVTVPAPDHDTVCAIRKFTDVNLDAWYHEALDYVLDNGVMQGVEETLFAPDSSLTRAMLVQIIYNLEGQPAYTAEGGFSDVAENQWFYDAVTWAAEQGIVNGYDNGCFGPDDKITREQLVTIIWRYAGSPEATADRLDFIDAADVDAYAVEAVIWATENGIVQGIGDGKFDPNGYSTRAQAAKVIQNYLEFTP